MVSLIIIIIVNIFVVNTVPLNGKSFSCFRNVFHSYQTESAQYEAQWNRRLQMHLFSSRPKFCRLVSG